MILRAARRDAGVVAERRGEERKEGRTGSVLAGEEERRWEGASELCGEQRAKSEMDGLTDVCLRMQRRARGSWAGGSPQAQPGERGQKRARACGSMLVLLLGAELTLSFPPSQDPEPDSRQDFIFA